ncbi:MAG TPA: hypothetical protein VH141_19860 [Pseudonocardia sp.]|nr:hypothetical protein [Pseudonocardia sp.]
MRIPAGAQAGRTLGASGVGRRLATPALAHLATNSLGMLIAWWLVSGR